MTKGWSRLFAAYARARWRFTRLRGRSLERFQDRRARRIVVHAMHGSPFHRELYAGRDPGEWRTFPVVDKATMMERFDEYNTRGISREQALAVALEAERSRDFRPRLGELTIGLSSGTSGHRGLFVVAPEEQSAWAGTILARALPRLPRRGLRIALFLRSNSNLYETLGSRWIEFRHYDLMTPLDEMLAALDAQRPDVLVAPPSLLGMFAQARAAGRLAIRPELVVSVAEVLEPQDRARLEGAFDAPVHQIYQCTEGLIAISCPRGTLHVQEDLVALQFEPIESAASDEPPRLVPIVTDLWRRAQPIIRYRLNDLLTLDPRPCACGSAFRVLAKIEGRCDDLCWFERPDGRLRPFFPDSLRRMVLLADPGITDYQVFQERPGRLRVHLEVTASAEFDAVAQAVRRSAAETVASHGCRLLSIDVERGLVRTAPDAKRRRVRCYSTVVPAGGGIGPIAEEEVG